MISPNTGNAGGGFYCAYDDMCLYQGAELVLSNAGAGGPPADGINWGPGDAIPDRPSQSSS